MFSVLGPCNPTELNGIHKYLARFGTLRRTDDTGSLELVHNLAGTVVSDGITALQV